MSYLVLARKWRPQRFADLTGQDVIVRTLKNALTSDHLAHAYLMTGIRGVGKTTISRLMAMAVNCTSVHEGGEPCGQCESCVSIAQGNNLDVQEMDAASHTGVDDIREILDGVRYPPVHLKIKVYIIDEAHMLSKSAFNALLKTLEEPPERVLFILATTESDKLPITVRSRCQRFDLRRLDANEICNYLAYVLQEEGIKVKTEALQLIARAADGSVRDALSLTERVLAFSNNDISVDDVEQSLGLTGSEQVQHLADAILSGDAQQSVKTLRETREMGIPPSQLLKALSECLHEISCCKLDTTLVPQALNLETQSWLLAQAEFWSAEALDMRYQVLIHGLRDIALVDEQRGAEMIVMRLSHLYTISPPEKKTFKNVTINAKKTLPPPSLPKANPNNVKLAAKLQVVPEASSTTVVESNIQDRPNTWEGAIRQYHDLKPGIAAILEHAICDAFESEVRLLLTNHQLESLSSHDRLHFEQWLKRNVVWAVKTNETGESLLDKQQRENDEYTRELWRQAESNPYVKALKEALDCRLINVRPPTIHFESDDVVNIEEEP